MGMSHTRANRVKRYLAKLTRPLETSAEFMRKSVTLNIKSFEGWWNKEWLTKVLARQIICQFITLKGSKEVITMYHLGENISKNSVTKYRNLQFFSLIVIGNIYYIQDVLHTLSYLIFSNPQWRKYYFIPILMMK